MSALLVLTPLETGEGATFEPPSVSSFDLPSLFNVPGLEWLNKYMLHAPDDTTLNQPLHLAP